MQLLIAAAAAYLLGSFPSAYLAGRLLRGIDIREHGSGNAGAANVLRILGPAAAAAVLLLDCLKGAAAVALAGGLAGQTAGPAGLPGVIAGACVMAGHLWPVFLGFRGGKGAATGAGALAALLPGVVPWCLGAFALAAGLTGWISLGSICAALVLPLAYWLDSAAAGPDPLMLGFCLAASAAVILKHRRNISRLLRGQEPRQEKIRFLRRLFQPRRPRPD